jgi:hypothetical protein
MTVREPRTHRQAPQAARARLGLLDHHPDQMRQQHLQPGIALT